MMALFAGHLQMIRPIYMHQVFFFVNKCNPRLSVFAVAVIDCDALPWYNSLYLLL